MDDKYDFDDIFILEVPNPFEEPAFERERQLRFLTIDALVSRELKEERALTGFAKARAKVNDLTLYVGVASGVSGLVGYLHDQSVPEYALKGGLVAATFSAVVYGLGKVIKYFKHSPEKTNEEKRDEKIKEYEQALTTRKNYDENSFKQKAVMVAIMGGAIAIVGGVIVAAPYATLAAWYGIGAGTGLASATSELAVKTGKELYSRKQKLEQYDLERARIVGAELFKK